MSITTRLQLRTDARVMADQDNSTFPTDAAYNSIINRNARRVWQRMTVVGWRPSIRNYNINTSVVPAIPGTFPIPFGLFEEGNVEIIDTVYPVGSATSLVPTGPKLHRLKPEELFGLLSGPGNPAVAYELTQGAVELVTDPEHVASLHIILYPTPVSGFYNIRGSRGFPGFFNDDDVWTGPQGSEELIVLASAIDGAMKEENNSHVAMLQSKLKERWSEVVEGAGFLDSQGQQTVRDARRCAWPHYTGDFYAEEGW